MKMRCPTIVETFIVVAIVALFVNLLQPGTGRSSPLCSAASSGDVAEVERLLDNGLADVNERDGRDRTPLHYAASCGQKDTARLLIEKGANIEARDYWEETPLHAAANYGKIEVVRLLVANGANVDAKGRLAGTPLDCAERAVEREAASSTHTDARNKDQHAQPDDTERQDYAEVITLLIAKGAKRSSALKNRR
jgi:ankyrin repeat protein